MGIKTQNLMLVLNLPIPYNFFWVNCFAFFSTDSKSVSNFAFYGNHIEFLQKGS
jgi:hypothetical protein